MPCATHLSQNNVDHLVKGKFTRLLYYTFPFLYYIFICVSISGCWVLVSACVCTFVFRLVYPCAKQAVFCTGLHYSLQTWKLAKVV